MQDALSEIQNNKHWAGVEGAGYYRRQENNIRLVGFKGAKKEHRITYIGPRSEGPETISGTYTSIH